MRGEDVVSLLVCPTAFYNTIALSFTFPLNRIPECHHTFCESCLLNWFENTNPNFNCPKCRNKVTKKPVPQIFTIMEMVSTLETTQARVERRGMEIPKRDPQVWKKMKALFVKPPPGPGYLMPNIVAMLQQQQQFLFE